jgi:transcriptional regulator with XRE-family HTH domain
MNLPSTGTFQARLRELVKAKRGTAARVARAAKVKPSYICMLCSGAKINPSSHVVKAIARELGVNSRWLLTGEGEQQPPAAAPAPRVGLGTPKQFFFGNILIGMESYLGCKPGDSFRSQLRRLMRQSVDDFCAWTNLNGTPKKEGSL